MHLLHESVVYCLQVFDALFSIVRTKGEAQKAAIELSMEVLTTLEEALKTVPKEPPFFGGASIGYVDIILSPFAVWYGALETVGEFNFPFEEKFPCLHAWLKATYEGKTNGKRVKRALDNSADVVTGVFNIVMRMKRNDVPWETVEKYLKDVRQLLTATESSWGWTR